LADEAAAIALEVFARDFEVRTKPDLSPVTEADLAIEARLRELVAERFPDDAVLGEEGGEAGPADARRVWVLDPIDGTKNFASRIQIWATLIALMVDGEPVLGLASAPAIGERYRAVRGGGATLNGRPVHVSAVDDLAASTVCTTGLHSFIGTPFERPFVDLAGRVARMRGFGDFWGHMLVARGSAEVMIEPDLRVWDWAAVAAIAVEAGGRVTTFDGGPLADHGSVLTTNGRLHDAVLAQLSGGSGPEAVTTPPPGASGRSA
jgi:histidinol-phosphatase